MTVEEFNLQRKKQLERFARLGGKHDVQTAMSLLTEIIIAQEQRILALENTVRNLMKQEGQA